MGGVLTRKRVGLMLVVTTVLFVLLLGRLAYVQFIWADDLGKRALDMRMRDIPIQPKRGIIYDRNGHELAISIDVESVYAIPAQVRDPEGSAKALSKILGLKYEKVLESLTRNSAFEWVKRKVPDDVAREIKALALTGVGFTQETMRVWPKGSLLAQTLGIVGIDNEGLEGLEYQYDRVLRGTPGKFTVEVDAVGEAMPRSQRGYVPPIQGRNLVLTVDEVVQFIVERELDKACKKHKADGGLVIAMDPRNGEILGMAMRPTYDPNEYDKYPAENRRIITVTDSYPPGSTFKPVTAAAALESGAISTSDRFHCGGSIPVGPDRLHCWDSTVHGSQSFYEVVQNSCNVGFVQIGLKTGADEFYKFLDLFGCTTPTGIDLPGEVRGLIVPKDAVKPIDLACMSFGQTLQMTPVQLIASISAIANGGYTVVPHLVKEVTEVDGTVVEVKPTGPVHRVISENTSAELCDALEQVVSKGTGKQAYVAGYRLAGKTGTSNKVVDGMLTQGRYLAWFIGFAPANDPRLALLVMVDEPKGVFYGSQVAAPVFSAVMKDVLRVLEIPPQEEPQQEPNRVSVPDFSGKEVVASLADLRQMGLLGQKEGPGNRVKRQFPVAGARVPQGTCVILYTEGEDSPPEGKVKVPSLVGLGLTKARLALSEAGLFMTASGSGFCVSQEPEAGTMVKPGSTVKAVFRMDVGE